MLDAIQALKSRSSPRQWRVILLALGPVSLFLVAAIYYAMTGHTVSTNNAYLKSGKVQISAVISGTIVDSRVSENARVKKGDVLFGIDPIPYEIALNRAEAQLSETKSMIAGLKARLAEIDSERESAKVEALIAERGYDRQVSLARTNVASASSRDAAEQAKSKAAQSLATIEQKRATILAELEGDGTQPIEQIASYKAAKAAYDQAALDLSHTKVVAPMDGIVSQTDNFRPGLYVRPGEAVFSLVESEIIWAEANMKETDVTDIRQGQPARVRVDAYPGLVWRAEVDSLSVGTGSEFALLPPQNATGNWVKVTQRVPVRLKLIRTPEDPPLRIGMSAKVKIDTSKRAPKALVESNAPSLSAADSQTP